jgi:diguanylate cyclase (GGDEF)-like protein
VAGWQDRANQGNARLVMGSQPDSNGVVPVLMVLRDASDARRMWLGELDPTYLFGEVSADGAGADICVFDAQGHVLACPGAQADAAQTMSSAPTALSWRLFLRADFGGDDWVLVNQAPALQSALASRSMAIMALLGGVATLLIVALLSLAQVRRTMVPLERLISGTRRLSQGEFSARVAHEQPDEFGELARSFNHMAERIGHQVEAMQVQSAIDREILNGLDVARILRQVAQRLAVLMPGASACVLEFDRAVTTLARVHRGDGAVTVLALPPHEQLRPYLDAGDGVNANPAPTDWLREALPTARGRVFVRAARVADATMALLLIDVRDGRIADGNTMREIDELSDRVAVALTSADRERRLLERATHDSLTGLANRHGLFEHLERLLADPLRRTPFSLLFVDLDDFKEVNDSLGHQTGDALLRALAYRLQDQTTAGTLLARPGGDEFVLVVPGDRARAQAVASTVLARLSEPVSLGARLVTVGCSLGMAHHPDDGDTVSDLLRRADMAMYDAKRSGGSRSVWFDAAMDARTVERAGMLADLRLALERGEFELHYQPRLTLTTGAVRCSEALLRWRRGGAELVPPVRFIDLLEESGLIDTVGLWVVESACRQLAAWRAAGLRLDSVAVNVSTRQLHAASFVQDVLAIVERSGLQPSDLELEITESVFIGNTAGAVARLHSLRAAGLGIALDDFGTGYSSLSYLHTLPISTLKVDRSFVSALDERESAQALTRAIVALASALRLEVVAEGVETQQQADLLQALGCNKLQGFLIAKPLPPAAFAQFCADRAPGLPARLRDAAVVQA